MMFREPKIVEMARRGDRRTFLCIIEGEVGQLTGGVFELSAREEGDIVAWTRGLEDAWKRARERAELGQWIPPGSDWEAFK